MKAELKGAYLFSELNDVQLDRLSAMSQRIRLRDGEALFELGDPAKRFFLVVAGQIKLSRLAMNGNEKVIEVVMPGHTFAEALMFADRPAYPVRARAIGEVELIAFNSSGFLDLLRESVDTCFRVMGDMSMRLRHMIKEIDDLTLQSASGRVAGFLCGKLLRDERPDASLDLEVPKGILASRLSVKPETFSRILHTFSEHGLIRVKGNHIEILDLEGLQQHADSAGICGLNFGPGKVG